MVYLIAGKNHQYLVSCWSHW